MDAGNLRSLCEVLINMAERIEMEEWLPILAIPSRGDVFDVSKWPASGQTGAGVFSTVRRLPTGWAILFLRIKLTVGSLIISSSLASVNRISVPNRFIG